MNNFQDRIKYKGDIKPVLESVCVDYNIGDYGSYSIVSVGYEDFNLILETTINKYFVKIFASFRNLKDCQRYIGIVSKVIESGVSHPKILKTKQGFLYSTQKNGIDINLCVEEFIDGESFYDSTQEPTNEDILLISQEAAKINKIDYRPDYLSDSWAVENLLTEFNIIEKYLSEKDKTLLSPIIEQYSKIDFDLLPHTLVHGDLIKTNILKSKNKRIYLIDFSVANYYPRIQELAILFCDIFFNESNPDNFRVIYQKVLSEYQKYLTLTRIELELLPIYIKFAHAMHMIGATREKYLNNNLSEENDYFLDRGRKGLEFMAKYFPCYIMEDKDTK